MPLKVVSILAIVTCFVYFNCWFAQGVWFNFGAKVPLDLTDDPPHTVDMLNSNTARRVGRVGRSWVCFYARDNEE